MLDIGGVHDQPSGVSTAAGGTSTVTESSAPLSSWPTRNAAAAGESASTSRYWPRSVFVPSFTITRYVMSSLSLLVLERVPVLTVACHQFLSLEPPRIKTPGRVSALRRNRRARVTVERIRVRRAMPGRAAADVLISFGVIRMGVPGAPSRRSVRMGRPVAGRAARPAPCAFSDARLSVPVKPDQAFRARARIAVLGPVAGPLAAEADSGCQSDRSSRVARALRSRAVFAYRTAGQGLEVLGGLGLFTGQRPGEQQATSGGLKRHSHGPV
jgi:hypothetical protein